jgi:hypothetical protein
MLVGLALLLAGSRVAPAQSITVTPGTTGPLVISTAVAGQQPVPVNAAGGTYQLRMKKNRGIGSITARLAAPLPAGTALFIQLASPGGTAQSAGVVQLGTSAQAVVTNLPNRNTSYPARAITYTFRATTAAGVVALRSASVILELAP